MIEELKNIGLSPKEAEIYSSLINQGEITANNLAKINKTNRTVTYNILQSLSKKGLISFVIKNSRRYYRITSPNNLLINVREKELLIKELISKINRINPVKKQENIIRVLEGKEGLRSVHENMINAKFIRIVNATGLIKKELRYSLGFLKQIAKNKVRIIANSSFNISELNLQNKDIKIKYLPYKKKNYATTFIFNDTIIILILKEPFLIISIKNRLLSEGYKLNFDLLWDYLK